MNREAFTRRSAVLGGLALGACAQSAPADPREAYIPPPDDPRFAAIERRIGGRVGVAAWNTGADQWLGYRRNERFAMCSTFKWLLAAQMLKMADLSQRVLFGDSDLLEYAPVTRARITDGPIGRMGAMTIEELCEAMVVVSDNTAANLLLQGAMGPQGFTSFLRANGDGVTRLDRMEPELNNVPPGDERDTTTPDVMARNLQTFLATDEVLNAAARERLIGWMIASTTGRERLRAGLPSDWRVGDKTGTSPSATNDVAIAWPPGRAPIVIACYLVESAAPQAERNAAHAEIGRIIAEEWA